MKNITTIIAVLIVLSGFLCYKLISNYEQIDRYNQTADSFQWVSRQGDETTYVSKIGSGDEYYIGVYTRNGDGIMDRNGKEILPCEYDAVEYKGGRYMAAATMTDWVLFDTKGQQVASFNRISLPYSYAGDRYFLRYGDDAIDDPADGFAILDAVSGEVVQQYENYYNAVRLDDGNWYISKTPDVNGAAARAVLNQQGAYRVKHPAEDAKAAPRGFFVDEDFTPLFDGKEYRLIDQRDGRYMVSVVESSAPGSLPSDDGKKGSAQEVIMVLDETGDLFQIMDKKLLRQIEQHEYGESGNWWEALSKEQAAFCEKLSGGFAEVVPLPGTNHYLVNGDLGCGIVRPWEE